MKVLSVTWTIYDESLQEFMSNCTGGGLVIKNLCEFIGKREESYLLIGKVLLPELQLGNIHIIKTDYDTNMKNVKGSNLKYIQYMTDIFEKAIDNIKPDIINFHGYGDFAFSCIKNVCIKRNLLYFVTEHLFIGADEVFEGYSEQVIREKYLYNIPEIKIIAVSNGMKQKILRNFPNLMEEQITVLLNGTDFKANIIENNLLDKYEIQNKKVLLCVGTILDRKNQQKIVEVFKKNTELSKKISVIFCGNDGMNGKLQKNIVENGLEKVLIYAGACSSEEMKKYYSVASGLIMPSYSEGFSIAALEAISYGLPIIMFRDLEFAEDLNDTQIVEFAENRTDKALEEAILAWYAKDWDTEYIKQYSKSFTMKRMADGYIDFYIKQLKNYKKVL